MGALYNLSLLPYIEKYNLSVFIETGTGEAVSLIDSFKYPFEKWYSIEIHEGTFSRLVQRGLISKNVSILNKGSVDGLKEIFEDLNKTDKNALIFSDAHFANSADFHQGCYLSCKGNKSLHLPLEDELRFIKENRPNNKDIIICDDVRIYQDGPFSGGNWEHREFIDAGTLDFAYEIFQDTHDLTIDFLDQGYLFIIPKS